MITNTGRNILSKYLVGQSSSYASHIAIGCGVKPIIVGDTFGDYSNKQDLDFEMVRVPIISRGYVYDDDGKPNIVFTAEIPGDQRYEISEVGVFSGRANPTAGNLDSRILYTFGEAENWEFHSENATLGIPLIVAPLNLEEVGNAISVEEKVFRTNSNNPIFNGPIRLDRQERPRFLNRAMLLRGDLSFLETVSGGRLQIKEVPGLYTAEHIHLNGTSLNLDKQSPEDEIRMAFSIINKDELENINIGSVKIMMEFADSDSNAPENYARFHVDVSSPTPSFNSNRYFVVKKKLSELETSSGFTWASVTSVRVYVTVIQQGQVIPSDKFYVSIDGVRLQNTTSFNPLYGLTGYTIVKTGDGRPIIKSANTSNFIEFRFGMDVA
jgi:hypothetical protein